MGIPIEDFESDSNSSIKNDNYYIQYKHQEESHTKDTKEINNWMI